MNRPTKTQNSLSSAALAARYGQAVELPTAGANAVIDSLLAHRSVRAYLDRPLAHGTLETLVAAAQSAPTSSNLQAWTVVAVEDPARKERLSKLAADQAHIRECPLFRRAKCSGGGRVDGTRHRLYRRNP